MRLLIAMAAFAALSSLAATADTNELERLRAEFLTARKAYMEARKAAGLTNSTPRRAALPRRSYAPVDGLAPTSVLTKEQKDYFKNKRICVKRDIETIPGSVISYWHRNGKPDTLAPAVVTNVLKQVVGREQLNPIQDLAEQLRKQVEEWRERATSAEARAARLDRLRDWLVEQRDKALLPTTKAIYQAIIDRIDEKLEGN